MFGTDVALMILLALVFGFVNGWLLCRQFSGGRITHEPPEFSLAEIATDPVVEGPSSDDVGRVADASNSDSAERLSQEPQSAGSEAERRALQVRLGTLEAQRREAEAEAGQLRTEVRNLTARIQLLEPLIDQVRERDARLSDLQRRHRDLLSERAAVLDIDEGRIVDLESAVSSLHARLEVFEVESASVDEAVARDARSSPVAHLNVNGNGNGNGNGRVNGFGDLERQLRADVADREAEIRRLRLMIEELRRGVAHAKAAIETAR